MDMEYESKWFDEFVATMDIGLMLEEADKKISEYDDKIVEEFSGRLVDLGYSLVRDSGDYVTLRCKKKGHLHCCEKTRINKCPECLKCSARKEISDIAVKNGGKLLSPRYIGESNCLMFRCKHGHSFYSNPKDIRIGEWCSECSTIYKSEGFCRRHAEIMDQVKYSKDHPEFLRRESTGRCMELDMYSKKLGLAIEYNGKQHYSFVPHFHKSHDDFEKRLEMDEWRRVACANAGVMLLEVPYAIKCKREVVIAKLEETAKERCFPSMINPEFRDMINGL